MDKWRAAVTDACVIAGIEWDENDPRGSLDRLIAWREEIALDPQVSARAAALASPTAPAGGGVDALECIAQAAAALDVLGRRDLAAWLMRTHAALHPQPAEQAAPGDQFCDGHCVWTNHHPDCVRAEQAASSGEAQREDDATMYLGVLWRHAAASFRNDDAEADKWAERGDSYHRKVGEPADYKDGARWLAQCVAEWPTTPPPAGPVAEQVGDAVQAIMHEVFKYADVAAPLRGPPMTQDESLPVRRAARAQDKVIRDMLYALATRPDGEARMKSCQCETCRPIKTLYDIRFIVCAICGNKRCPHATNHKNPCTNSNAPGQKGSSWENYKID